MSDSLDEFVRTHEAGLLRFAYVVSGRSDAARDLVQEAFLELAKREGQIAAPTAYARRVIVTRHVSAVRRLLRPLPALLQRDAEHPAGELADRDVVWRRLAEMSPRQRVVLVLRYYEDLPDREIADVLGIRVSSVRSLAARAFAELRADPNIRDLVAHKENDHA